MAVAVPDDDTTGSVKHLIHLIHLVHLSILLSTLLSISFLLPHPPSRLLLTQFVMMKPLLTALPFLLRLYKPLDYDGRLPILNHTINLYSPKLYIQVRRLIKK